jgi:cell division protein FtsL
MNDSIDIKKYWTVSGFGFVCFVMLIIVVMGTAMGIIVTTFENRRHLAELELLRRDARDMQVLWGQYLAEKSTWADYARVHQMAEQGLEMQRPKTNEMIIVKVMP